MINPQEASPSNRYPSMEEKVRSLTPERLTMIARGLTRTKATGSRHPSGLPITEEGQIMEELMRQNNVTAEGAEDQNA